jgi:hypothetical protein
VKQAIQLSIFWAEVYNNRRRCPHVRIRRCSRSLDFGLPQDDPCDRDASTAIKSVCKVQLPILKYIEIEELFLSYQGLARQVEKKIVFILMKKKKKNNHTSKCSLLSWGKSYSSCFDY